MFTRKRSQVWLHFTAAEGEKAKCNHCKSVISYKGGGSSNLMKHLASKHPTVNLRKPCESKEKPCSSQKLLDEYSINKRLSKSRERQIDNALVKMITKDLQPFSIVEDEGFKLFAKSMNPAYVLPSRYILTTKFVLLEYEKGCEKLRINLKNVQNICITTDAWTSVANESYISITSHFINSDWKLNSKFLTCFKMMKVHTAEHLKDELLEALKVWNIESKVSCVVSDNAANIIAAIKIAGWRSLPCIAHTLHLIVTDGLNNTKIRQLIAKCKSAVEFFHRSTKATNKLKEMQEQMGKKKLKLINSTPTRWNSTLNMINRIIENQEVLEATVAILHKPVELFCFEEWQILREVCNILSPFNEITIEMSAERFTTVSKIIVLIRGLQSFLNKKIAENNTEEITTLLQKYIDNINKRFYRLEFNEILAISTYLDPRFKSKGFTDQNAVKYVKERISSMFHIQNFEASQSNLKKTNSETNNSIWNEFDSKNVIKTANSECIVELNNYSHEDILDRNLDPLEWWKARETIYPGLSIIAKKYLPIVATSVPSERVFSKASQILTDRRNLLSADNVNKVLFLHYNSE